ncbi:MAG TPA: DUF2125 domain-containing protein [Rhizomicrobium sp.]|nr:DUF2125 domain-containing protein [Rhizomicrobium sp.]
MKYSSRFFLYAPLGVFLALLAIAGVHWWILASRLGDWLDAHNGREVMPGVTMQFAARQITGFPFSLDTEFSDFAINVATPSGPTRWRSGKFAMHALTYGRDETIFEAAGHQRLEWTDQGRTRHILAFAVGALHASAIVHHEGLDRFDLDLVGLGSKAFTAQRLQLHARQNAKTTQIFVTADGLTGCARSSLRYEASLTIDEAFERLQIGGESWSDAVAAWRAAGGTARSGTNSALSSMAADEVLNPSAVADAACR